MNAKIINLAIKPALTAAHKVARMKYVLAQADRSHGVLRHVHHYKTQLDVVHVDESWFYLNLGSIILPK